MHYCKLQYNQLTSLQLSLPLHTRVLIGGKKGWSVIDEYLLKCGVPRAEEPPVVIVAEATEKKVAAVSKSTIVAALFAGGKSVTGDATSAVNNISSKCFLD